MAATAMLTACMQKDVNALRKLCEGGADVNERDASHGQTPLMVAATLGDMESAWLLIDAKADPSLRDTSGMSALDLARTRDHIDVVQLLGGCVASAGTGMLHIPDFSSDEEEPPPEKGHVLVLDHIVSLSSVDLMGFAWSRYENGLAKLAGVDPQDVFITPEPGRGVLELHATVVKRLKAEEAWSAAGIDECMATIKSLQRRQPLTQASGGLGTLAAPATVKLYGEAHDAAEAVSARVAALRGVRQEYDEERDIFERSNDVQARGLAASKAILLLKREREAIKTAAAKAAHASDQRKKRQGGGSGR